MQYSNDGVNWDSAVGLGSWSTSGWEYPTTWEDMPPSGQADRLFVRFGLLTTNSGGTVTECHSAKMVVDIAPVRGARTITADTVLCMSPKTGAGGGAGANRPMTDAISTDGIEKARATWNLQGETGSIVTRAWFQTSEDGVDWNGGQSLSATSLNNDGWKYNTTWTDLNLSADDRFIRFCIRTARPGGNNTQQMGQCTLRIDVRGE